MKQIRAMWSLPALLALLACDGRQADVGPAERIECAVDGAERFESVCTLERAADGRSFILRGPSGGFRRIAFTEEGVAAADGAEAARVTPLSADLIEVEIAGDVYRLPVGVNP